MSAGFFSSVRGAPHVVACGLRLRRRHRIGAVKISRFRLGKTLEDDLN
jgi:hypothetical protein